MNKTLAITAIALVAVVMGISAVAPMIPQVYADRHTGDLDRCKILEINLEGAGLSDDLIKQILERARCTSGGGE